MYDSFIPSLEIACAKALAGIDGAPRPGPIVSIAPSPGAIAIPRPAFVSAVCTALAEAVTPPNLPWHLRRAEVHLRFRLGWQGFTPEPLVRDDSALWDECLRRRSDTIASIIVSALPVALVREAWGRRPDATPSACPAKVNPSCVVSVRTDSITCTR